MSISGRRFMKASLSRVINDLTSPSAPSNLVATATESTTIALTWDVATDNVGVVNYSVYRNNFKIAYPTDNSFVDTGLSPSTSYFYYIKAYDAAGNISAQSNTATAVTLDTVDTTPPTSPTNLAVTGVTASSVSLSWSAAKITLGSLITVCIETTEKLDIQPVRPIPIQA